MAPSTNIIRSMKRKATSEPNISTHDTSDGNKHFKHTHDDKIFRFLDLPAELRNNVYGMVAEDTKAYLIKSARGRLVSSCALVRASRQLRDEFLAILTLRAPVIIAKVRGADFRRIVTFLNRLSDAELNALTTTAISSTRKLQIDFHIYPTGFSVQKLNLDLNLLWRWLKRAGHPTKKGTMVQVSYVVINDASEDGWSGWYVLPSWLRWARQSNPLERLAEELQRTSRLKEGRSKEEANKLAHALKYST